VIAFSCSQCGMKLKVKDQFAGRQSKCPSCKQPLVVPLPSHVDADVPAGQIDSTANSVAEAGMDGGVTLEAVGGDKGGQKSIRELLAQRPKKSGRYILEGEIARGGMGAVLRAVDCDIRREVAVKYMLSQGDSKKNLRFVEEAQITGQLEHPNIVPIHELGIDGQKRLFFSMKMVKGRSLAEVLDQLRLNPNPVEKEYPLGRLLNVFINVCNALAYAHSRGVVHRDLKPPNIMIGDFGEVYVMDWGLAKVLNRDGRLGTEMVTLPPADAPSEQKFKSPGSNKVVTDREPELVLTQEGAILGTPFYMPPEQAAGQIHAIDQRSDIYSLGAILYELLTLQPPIDKEGGILSVMMRVMQGEIVPPERRDPKRTKAGKVPKELAAIAMKAMMKAPEDRYPNIEALRKDIERFQEGRSVSAKEDTTRELVWKFAKRNKGFTAGAAAALIVLVTSLVFVFQAWRDTRAAQDATRKEQADKENALEGKRRQMVQSVPAFLEAARFSINQRKFDIAAKQVGLALEYDRDDADAHLLKAQLLLGDKDITGARVELNECLRQRPQDPTARKLAEVCREGSSDAQVLFAAADELQRQQLHGLAGKIYLIYQLPGQSLETQKRLGEVYRKRIEEAWPGLGGKLNVDERGQIHLNLSECKQVVDLKSLEGMKLTSLNLGDLKEVDDLKPIAGMPLTFLCLVNCRQVKDLTPLKGMPLGRLDLRLCGQVSDLTPLKGMPLTDLSLIATGVQDLAPLQGMPLTTLELEAGSRVHDLTPLKGMNLRNIYLAPKSITNGMDVLRQMKSLQRIGLDGNTHWPPVEFWKKYEAGDFK